MRDTNFCAYPATGIWHHFLTTGDRAFLARYFPVVERALDWVLTLQSADGEFRWSARDPRHAGGRRALRRQFLDLQEPRMRCPVRRRACRDAKAWRRARAALGDAIRNKPERFDRTWGSKAHFAMDWYYPVLSGAISGDDAKARIAARFDEFVAPGMGCRCLSGVPWVTIAESAELALALLRVGRRDDAARLLDWQHQWRDDSGAYFMGHQYADGRHWPAERPAWTAAAIILAHDAITGETPAAALFRDTLPEAL